MVRMFVAERFLVKEGEDYIIVDDLKQGVGVLIQFYNWKRLPEKDYVFHEVRFTTLTPGELDILESDAKNSERKEEVKIEKHNFILEITKESFYFINKKVKNVLDFALEDDDKGWG